LKTTNEEVTWPVKFMVDTFYLHLEFKGKNGWSINLPFMCIKAVTAVGWKIFCLQEK